MENEVCGDTDESLSRLRSVPATTALTGVVLLLGGVVEVCPRFLFSFAEMVDVSG
jgi:hypothetical protein